MVFDFRDKFFIWVCTNLIKIGSGVHFAKNLGHNEVQMQNEVIWVPEWWWKNFGLKNHDIHLLSVIILTGFGGFVQTL